MELTVYTGAGDWSSHQALKLLRDKEIPHLVVEYKSGDPGSELLSRMAMATGETEFYFPQIFDGDTYVGSLNELKEYVQ